ncbi:MAG: hypothetical protein KDB74_01525 [Flavobacteriales bacterium]|nr:hypothetical protein [Flavobacteriales bacterium]
MKRISQLKKLAIFAKEHGVIQMEFTPEGDVIKMLFMHKDDMPAIEMPSINNEQLFNTAATKQTSEDDDLFYSVDFKPKPIKKRDSKNENK